MKKKRSIAAAQSSRLDERTAADASFVIVDWAMADASSTKLDEAIVGGYGAPAQAMKKYTKTGGLK